MLGHSGVAITLDRYSHVIPTMQEEAARRMDLLLGAEACKGICQGICQGMARLSAADLIVNYEVWYRIPDSA